MVKWRCAFVLLILFIFILLKCFNKHIKLFMPTDLQLLDRMVCVCTFPQHQFITTVNHDSYLLKNSVPSP